MTHRVVPGDAHCATGGVGEATNAAAAGALRSRDGARRLWNGLRGPNPGHQVAGRSWSRGSRCSAGSATGRPASPARSRATEPVSSSSCRTASSSARGPQAGLRKSPPPSASTGSARSSCRAQSASPGEVRGDPRGGREGRGRAAASSDRESVPIEHSVGQLGPVGAEAVLPVMRRIYRRAPAGWCPGAPSSASSTSSASWAENRVRELGVDTRGAGFHVASLSAETIVYKGMLYPRPGVVLLRPGPERPRLRHASGHGPQPLLDQHLPQLGQSAAASLHEPQRRDQHRARQHQQDVRPPRAAPERQVRRQPRSPLPDHRPRQERLGAMIDIMIIDYSIGLERLSRICRQLGKESYPTNDDDLYRVSPLLREHINMLGRYSFSMSGFP